MREITRRKMNQETTTTTTSTLYPISSSDQNVNNVENKDHQESKAKPKRYGLVSFWELPEYMKDNEYVLHYYRANWPIKEALFSIFRWHNETLNVWTYVLLNYDNFFFQFFILLFLFSYIFTDLFGFLAFYFQAFNWFYYFCGTDCGEFDGGTSSCGSR